MAYLLPADYVNYGLPAGTTPDWITAATALINSFCRRPDLNVIQYQERLRIVSGTQTVLLSYLPLALRWTAGRRAALVQEDMASRGAERQLRRHLSRRRWPFRCLGSGRRSIHRRWIMRRIRAS